MLLAGSICLWERSRNAIVRNSMLSAGTLDNVDRGIGSSSDLKVECWYLTDPLTIQNAVLRATGPPLTQNRTKHRERQWRTAHDPTY